jgi:sugar phosphate isomerase/epimerase
MLSLSSCWNSQRYKDGADIGREARRLGFGYIELSHGLKVSHLPGIMRMVDRGKIKVSSVHNFCPSPVEVIMDAPDAYEFTSHREADRERALDLTEKTLETAARLGASRVVMHLGSVPMKSYTKELETLTKKGKIYSRDYTKLKLELVEKRARASELYLKRASEALEELLPLCAHHRVALGIETRSHFEQVPNEPEMLQLMARYQDNPWIGFWHDFGHVQRKANLGLLNHAELLGAIAPRLLGCHVHDVAWPHKDHRVPFTGGDVDFDLLMPLVPKDIPLVWELSHSQKSEDVEQMIGRWREKFGE